MSHRALTNSRCRSFLQPEPSTIEVANCVGCTTMHWQAVEGDGQRQKGTSTVGIDTDGGELGAGRQNINSVLAAVSNDTTGF